MYKELHQNCLYLINSTITLSVQHNLSPNYLLLDPIILSYNFQSLSLSIILTTPSISHSNHSISIIILSFLLYPLPYSVFFCHLYFLFTTLVYFYCSSFSYAQSSSIHFDIFLRLSPICYCLFLSLSSSILFLDYSSWGNSYLSLQNIIPTCSLQVNPSVLLSL